MTELTLTDVAMKLLLIGKLKATDVEADERKGIGKGNVLIDEIRISEWDNGFRRLMFLQEGRVIIEGKAQSEGNMTTLKFDCLIPVEVK